MMEVLINGQLYIPAPPQGNSEDFSAALNCVVRYGSNDELITARDFLWRLLDQLWGEQECFSSKYPFGSSHDYWSLLEGLALSGFVEAEIRHIEGNPFPSVDIVDKEKADLYVRQIIRFLFYDD